MARALGAAATLSLKISLSNSSRRRCGRRFPRKTAGFSPCPKPAGSAAMEAAFGLKSWVKSLILDLTFWVTASVQLIELKKRFHAHADALAAFADCN